MPYSVYAFLQLCIKRPTFGDGLTSLVSESTLGIINVSQNKYYSNKTPILIFEVQVGTGIYMNNAFVLLMKRYVRTNQCIPSDLDNLCVLVEEYKTVEETKKVHPLYAHECDNIPNMWHMHACVYLELTE